MHPLWLKYFNEAMYKLCGFKSIINWINDNLDMIPAWKLQQCTFNRVIIKKMMFLKITLVENVLLQVLFPEKPTDSN